MENKIKIHEFELSRGIIYFTEKDNCLHFEGHCQLSTEENDKDSFKKVWGKVEKWLPKAPKIICDIIFFNIPMSKLLLNCFESPSIKEIIWKEPANKDDEILKLGKEYREIINEKRFYVLSANERDLSF